MKVMGKISEVGLNRSTRFEYYRALGSLKYYERAIDGIEKIILEELTEPVSDKYTCDFYVLQLAKICIKNNDPEKAEHYLKMILNSSYKNEAILWLGYIEMKKQNYEKAYEYITSIKITDNDTNPGTTIASKIKALNYIKIQLGIERYYPSRFKKNHNYHISQTENYSENAAKQHIVAHTEIEDYEPIRETLFLQDVNTDSIFDEVKEKISNEYSVGFSDVDRYILPLGRTIGTVKGKETDTVLAITLLNQPDKILTIYPSPALKLNKKVRK